jgi:phage-related protein
MKPIRFLGDSLKCLREFPDHARQDAGYQLVKVQQGQQPDDFKPMPSIGSGVEARPEHREDPLCTIVKR